MKKVLFGLLVAAIFFPCVAKAQQVVNSVDITVCDSFYWNRSGKMYKSSLFDTVIGADTLFVLNLTVKKSSTADLGVVNGTCDYRIGSEQFVSSGDHHVTLENAEGCDSVVSFNLVLSKQHFDTIVVVSCMPYQFYDVEASVTNEYSKTIRNEALSCDTIRTLNYTLSDTIRRDIPMKVCGSYKWKLANETYFIDTVVEKVVSKGGSVVCDSVLTLKLDIVVDSNYVTDSACASYTFKNSVFNTTGIHEHLATNNTTKCTTYTKLNLTIRAPYQAVRDSNVSVCNLATYSFATSGRVSLKAYKHPTPKTYSSIDSRIEFTSNDSVVAVYSYRTMANCKDSTLSVNIVINPNARRVQQFKNVCDTFTWDMKKVKFTASGKDSLTRAGVAEFGCDSVYVVEVTINPSPVVSSILGKNKVKAGEKVKLYAVADQSGLTYTWQYGATSKVCDTLIIPFEELDGNLDVTVTAKNKTTSCTGVNWITILYNVGIDAVEDCKMSLYPNPAVRSLCVESDSYVNEARVYNASGQVVVNAFSLGKKSEVDVSMLRKGVYTIMLSLENGKVATRKFVVSK